MDLVWIGPKIVRKANKTYAIYNAKLPELTADYTGEQVPSDQGRNLNFTPVLTVDSVPPEIKRISEKLPYGEFRRVRYRDTYEIAQFIYPLSPEAEQAYQRQEPDPQLGDLGEMTTRKILLYAHQKSQRTIQNSTLMKSRQTREKQWKAWWVTEEQKNQDYETTRLAFQQQIVNTIQLPPSLQAKLLPFQQNHVRNLIACLSEPPYTALDASDTGTGKTYVALAIAKYFRLIPIVVCPKSIIAPWERVMTHFELEEYYVANYEKYRAGKTPYLQKDQTQTTSQKYDWHFAKPTDYLLIFDECHKVKSSQTQNFAFFASAQKQTVSGLKVLCLSATTCDRIEQAYPISLMLSLTTGPKIFRQKYVLKSQIPDGILKNFGYEVSPSTGFYRFNPDYREPLKKLKQEDRSLRQLSRDIFPEHGARMKIQELGDSFPNNFIQVQAYQMDQADQIQGIYQQMAQQILFLKMAQQDELAEELYQLEHLSQPTDQDLTQTLLIQKKYERATQQIDELRLKYQLTKSRTDTRTLSKTPQSKPKKTLNLLQIMQEARQQVELLRVATFLELGLDFLEQGKSLVIFVNFVKTLETLTQAFHRKGYQQISLVQGGQSQTERDQAIDRFQSNDHQILISTIQSGGVGLSLHDLDGGHPRVSLISPTWSASDLLQALGRIYRAGAKSPCLQYVIYSAETIEEKICETIRTKIANINTLNNGDLTLGLTI